MVGIYAITNIANNKIYIGQSTDVTDRLAHHKSMLRHNRHENKYLQNAWNKYGESNFEFSILEECNESEIDELERKYIQLYDSMNRDKGYNFESGGSLHKHMSEESKRKMSLAKQGMYIGQNNPMYGIHLKHTEEWKQNTSKRFSGEGNPMYGRGKETRCIETNQIFATASEASRAIGVDASIIQYAARTKTAKAGGYHWEYVV